MGGVCLAAKTLALAAERLGPLGRDGVFWVLGGDAVCAVGSQPAHHPGVEQPCGGAGAGGRRVSGHLGLQRLRLGPKAVGRQPRQHGAVPGAAVGRGGVVGRAERTAGLAPLGGRIADLARCRLGAMDLRRRIEQLGSDSN